MWNLTFISEEDFTNHVKATIEKYGEKLESFDLKRFNKNIIDPIKLIFDKTVYQSSWEEIVSNEIFRQRDKSNNNDTPSVIKLKSEDDDEDYNYIDLLAIIQLIKSEDADVKDKPKKTARRKKAVE